MKNGVLETADLVNPIPVYSDETGEVVGIIDSPESVEGIARIRPLQGAALTGSIYGLYTFPDGREQRVFIPDVAELLTMDVLTGRDFYPAASGPEPES